MHFIKYCKENFSDWQYIFTFCQKQGVLGIFLEELEGEKQDDIQIPKDILLQWIGIGEQIKCRNTFINKRCVEISELFASEGYKCCILKGQGNSILYPQPLLRTPGDIDVWLLPKREERNIISRIIQYIKIQNPSAEARYHHIDYGNYKGVEVEVHYRPMYMFNPIHNYRLQKWFVEQQKEQFLNKVKLIDTDKQVCVPTIAFNRIYLLSHISCHFFIEGVGLRQLLDYYYVLQHPVLKEIKVLEYRLLKWLGLYDMAAAVMYVLEKVCGLEQSLMIVPADEKRGGLLLEEMLRAGNLGQYDEGLGRKSSRITRNYKRLLRIARMVRYFPSESLCEPFFRVWHMIWRLIYL